MRHRLSYANVAATLALVFSMTGGALAAGHYLITSTKQISPKVLKKLTGAPGKTGPVGPAGAGGAAGAVGKEGAQGVPGTPGSAGKAGVAGTEGAEGREGPEGPEGERGPSEAFTDHVASLAFSGTAGQTGNVASVSLPAGSYAILATLAVADTGVARDEVECALVVVPANSIFDATTIVISGNDARSLALSEALTTNQTNTVSLGCKSSGTEGSYEAVTLTATRVASITG
jgi:hypothetical protein